MPQDTAPDDQTAESIDPAGTGREENSFKIVWTLAWPAVALNALQTINSLLDSYFVQHLSDDALTAIGAGMTASWLLLSLSMAMGVAATAMVARAFGEGETEKIRETSRRSLGFAVLAGIVLLLLALPLARPAAAQLIPANAPGAATMMISFLTIVSLSLPASFIIQTLAGSLRGIGDTKSPMVISGIQIVLHILLNYLLIFGDHPVSLFGLNFSIPGAGWGLDGAAWAMTFSTWISAVGYVFWCGRTPLGIMWQLRFPGMEWTQRIFRLAAPASLMSIVRVTSLLAFMSILKLVPEGNVAIGAIRPGFSIEALAFMPAFGLAIAASALVGQSLGMGDPRRASRLGWMAAHQAGIVSTVVAALLFIFADPVARTVLHDKPEFAKLTADYIRYICATETLFGYAMVLISAMQGAGDTVRPFWITVVCMWLVRVPLAALLSLERIPIGSFVIPGFGMGASGCWLSMAITQAIQGLAAIWLWHRGDWKTARV